jgi:hypothetical protein
VRPVNETLGVQNLKVLANRNLRGFELPGKISD